MSELASLRIGFVGGGAMAEALVGGLIAAGLQPVQLVVSDPDAARREHLKAHLGVTATESNADAAAGRDVVVLAVKPNVVSDVLRSLGPAAGDPGPLWISIAAGVSLATLASALPRAARIVRAMPNTPALVGSSATAIVGGPQVGAGDLALATALFRCVGTCWTAPSEKLLDAVTGLSGSGPAYVFVFLEALSDAGVRVGLPREAATALAVQTVLGAAQLAFETGRHPAQLKDQVTSPGGTTIAGLERLEAGGLRAAVYEAVAAATARSRELSREE